MTKHPLTVTLRCEIHHIESKPESRRCYSLNPRVRFGLGRQSYLISRIYKRGRVFSALMWASMLLFGATPKHRIYT